MKQRLKPLFENDKKGKDRRWTFAGIIESLKQISRNHVSMSGVDFYRNTAPTISQNKILELLQVKIN